MLSLVALAALVVGVPSVLLWLGTVPAHLPTLADVREALLSQDDSGTSLVATMTLAAWAAWLWLTIPVLIEAVSVLARRTTPRLPGMATGQRLAGYLITGLLLAAPAAAASAADLTAGPAATAPHAPTKAADLNSDSPSAGHHRTGAAAAMTATTSAPETAEYTVGAGGTTWWELAEQLFGDGARYPELRTINPDVPATQSLLPEGTTLHIPAAHSPAAARQQTIEPAAYTQPAAPDTAQKDTGVDDSHHYGTYTVHSGDSLSRIAQRQLGDADRWPDLYAASEGRSQPDGLPRITDPDLIYPGQTVTLPHATQPAHSGAATGQSRQNNEPDHEEPAPPVREHSSSPATPKADGPAGSVATPGTPPVTEHSERTTRDADPSATPSGTAQPDDGSRPATVPPADSSSRTGELRTTLGAFALLAAAVTGALGTRRLLQRRRRKVGETIAIAEAPSPAAAQLAQLAEPPAAPRFDRALRTLADHADRTEQPLPELRAARLGPNTLSVQPVDEDAGPMLPFTAAAEGWWVLPDDAELLTTEQALDVTPPYPAFVTIGADEATGDVILLNLAAVRAVLLDGTEDDIRQVCRALVLELAMSAWADRLEIVTVGFVEELTHLLPTMRIGHKRQPAHALRDLADWLLASVQLPDDTDQPYLLVCATSLDADTAWQLAEMLDKAGELPALLIAPADHAARHFAQAPILDAAATTAQPLDGTDITVVLQHIDDAAYQQIITDLEISSQPPHPAEGGWQNVPTEPADPPAKAKASSSSRIRPPVAAVLPEPSSTTGSGPADLDVFPALLSATAKTTTAQQPPDQSAPAPPEPAPASTRLPTRADAAGRPAGHRQPGPFLSVLGPVQISSGAGSSHGPRESQLAALLHFKPGRGADTLCTDMDPLTPWTRRTLNTRMGDLRRALGDDPDGNPYIPRRSAIEDPYAISPNVLCDWDGFKDLAEQALRDGPSAVARLEDALGMVRGRPFGAQPLPWAEPYAQEMVTRIIDVAHSVAQWRMLEGPGRDLAAARQAVAVGLEVDGSAELLYRDWFRIEHASGNRSGLHTAISRLQQVNRSIDASQEDETQHLIHSLLASPAELSAVV
ncbi:LysM peptidoglycan-binding domain-containing protein [Streptomyces sp. NBC_01571]|uniref:LysM peptidoglycan-binding domain-containing protein n=1 Tax=Streptomyces sp. NBC_01571 TaxID=2975883 RepID=UPI002256A1EA|nr:LysM peptidoglycan-binding domain-containing protein [Streptomyces sp. NBC_01571]MCX4581067.1 LysM peptidoglycan-binding domain-containing protein [Streptomyces sp. NBC_01571]